MTLSVKPTKRYSAPLTTPLRYTFAFSLLMIICLMPVLAGLYFESYRQAEKSARLRLQTEQSFVSKQAQNFASIDSLFHDTRVIALHDAPPAVWRQQLTKKTIRLTAKMITELNWSRYQLSDDMLVTLIPNTKILLALPVQHKRFMLLLLQSLLYLSIVVVIVMFIFALVVSSRIMRRIDNIDYTAKEILAGDIKKRIPVFGHDEFSRLSQTLNAMLEKMQNLMADLRQTNNNIAHDLKSPLNRLRSRIEVTLLNPRNNEEYRRVLTQSIEDIDDLLSTFNALLLMGNLDSHSRNYQLKPLALKQLLTDMGDLYSAIAEEKQQTLTVKLADDIQILANKNLFAQAIGNLLDNAIKYTPNGGSIGLSAKRQAGAAIIVIDDNGPGIPINQHKAVFKRFSRLDKSRHLPGTGLGMALVRSILNAHNATIKLSDNHPGLRIEIRLSAISLQPSYNKQDN